MPLPGGPSDKIGNRYELWWTVSQLVRMLHGEIESIRLEDPGVNKAEFVVLGRCREFHQAKRSHHSGKWTLATLGGSDVQLLQAIRDQLTGNDDHFVFVSSSDSRELAELSERAQQAETLEEFQKWFLKAEQLAANFKKLCSIYWKNLDTASAYNILRRIEIRTMDEKGIEQQAEYGLRALFLANPADLCSELRRITQDSIHKTISRAAIIDHLAQCGFKLRRLTMPEKASVLVGEVTKHFLDGARKKLIRKSLLPRAATESLLTKLDGSAHDFIITGKAGVGKTGCVVEFVEAVQARNIPVLAFRLDRLGPVSTTAELGQQLGLEESPTLVLAAAAAGPEAVLVIDQLDAVGTTSGRITNFLDAVEDLLAEARGLRGRLALHVVLVCREFDWENDHRLRQLLPKEHAKVEVTEFSADEAKRLLSDSGFDIARFLPRQLSLLRLPQNLSLFLDSNFDCSQVPKFDTAKDLFDRYWEEKRRAVSRRTAPASDQWMDVIGKLCREMTDTQQLSIPREKLDSISADYLAQMASEGVLTFDGLRYGFGHESFFDYCFARSFITKRESLVAFLTKSEQHLFRRAQVRQVLTYLREADHKRYCDEICKLIGDESIRVHLKDLALALIADVPNPTESEWTVLEPCINRMLKSVATELPTIDKMAVLAWQHFFSSLSWFDFVDRRSFIENWLASTSDALVNTAVMYLRFHQRQSPDRIAALLLPYTNLGGEWTSRLRFITEWADHTGSRRFFELLLLLVDNGTLDDARGPIAVNSTFWTMFYDLETTRPEWIPELIAHWLRRRLILISVQNERPDWGMLFNNDNFATKPFLTAGAKAASQFVREVLPIILEITDLAVSKKAGAPPKRDGLWPVIFKSNHLTADNACLNALITAVTTLAADSSIDLHGTITALCSRDTYVANFLLLHLYAAGMPRFADEAVDLLCRQPWRFECGFSDSAHWCAMQLIRVAAPVCTVENRVRLEEAILRYTSPYERTAGGFKTAGHTRYVLLSAIMGDLRSKNASRQYDELERKFGKLDEEPQKLQLSTVESPISQNAAEKMTDEQWLKAMARYNFEERWQPVGNFLKGGARDLALMLREFVERNPKRFSDLALRFPADANPVYLEQTLFGLKGKSVPSELKIAVCRKAYQDCREQCGITIADVLGTVEDALPDDCAKILEWLATEHPDPGGECCQKMSASGDGYDGREILSKGINSARGRAAEAIRDLILRDTVYIERFCQTLERMVQDRSICVRSCVASALQAVACHNTQLSLELFLRMDIGDDLLLGTTSVERFIRNGLLDHFKKLRPYVERMLRSNEDSVCEAGARLASIAALHHESAGALEEEAMAGNRKQRHGVAQVASANVNSADHAVWCKKRLAALFNDDDADIRREAALCFRYLGDASLETYADLISAFCNSKAFQDDSFSILHALENSVRQLPGITCDVCEKFLNRFGAEDRDIRTSRAGDVLTVVKLIFRTYHQHQADEWTARCLNLIDRMCLEGIADAKREFEEFER